MLADCSEVDMLGPWYRSSTLERNLVWRRDFRDEREAAVVLADYSQVEILGLRYKIVNFGAQLFRSGEEIAETSEKPQACLQTVLKLIC